MSAPTAATTATPSAARSDPRDLLPQWIYRFRMMGMGLAGVPIALVLLELDAPIVSWIWAAFTCLVWPHLAYWRARRSPSPFRTELGNLVLDSAIAGSWVVLMHFTVLPSVLVITVATADKINSGVRDLWRRSLPGMLLAMVIGGLLTGFAFRPETSMPVVLACLPLMLIHTIGVSMASYRLVRRVQRQNRRLDELSRIDALTGLDNRGAWQHQAEDLLARSRTAGRAATLMMVDVDAFKDINDRHGHMLGDDVLREIAAILRKGTRADALIGRFGGDEFAIALPQGLAETTMVAERIRHMVEHLTLPQAPDVRCSISLGLAEAGPTDTDLRQWMESADRVLYQAKQTGRNRIVGKDDAVLVDA